MTDRTCPFPLSEKPEVPLPGRVVKSFKDELCQEVRRKTGQLDSCANFTVIPKSHTCLPRALHLPLPTLNLREQQSTTAIFSAGLRAEVQAGENEIRDPLSVKIQQQLQGLCSWKKGEASHCPET